MKRNEWYVCMYNEITFINSRNTQNIVKPLHFNKIIFKKIRHPFMIRIIQSEYRGNNLT